MLKGSRAGNILLFAKDRSETADLGSERGSHVLRSIRHQVFDSSHNVVEKGSSVNQFAEA
jgi:hypothetical protein